MQSLFEIIQKRTADEQNTPPIKFKQPLRLQIKQNSPLQNRSPGPIYRVISPSQMNYSHKYMYIKSKAAVVDQRVKNPSPLHYHPKNTNEHTTLSIHEQQKLRKHEIQTPAMVGPGSYVTEKQVNGKTSSPSGFSIKQSHFALRGRFELEKQANLPGPLSYNAMDAYKASDNVAAPIAPNFVQSTSIKKGTQRSPSPQDYGITECFEEERFRGGIKLKSNVVEAQQKIAKMHQQVRYEKLTSRQYQLFGRSPQKDREILKEVMSPKNEQ